VAELAKQFQVSEGVISKVRTNEIWKNDNYDPSQRIRHLEGCQRGRATLLTPNQVRQIRILTNTSTAALARQFGVHWSTVKSILSRRTWKNL
jgi:DNA-binding transcriptional regulator YiaG